MTKKPLAIALLLLQLLLAACSLRPVDLNAQRPLALRSTILAADGSVLARLYEQNRAYVPLERIPPILVDAVLAAEDSRFYLHGGFDVRAVARALAANLREGTVVQGGSTITQQYVKNTYFRDPGRTFGRKALELRLALEVERRLPKQEILERYLNTVYFGDGAYGIKAAAEVLFGRPLHRLTVRHAALLAALIKAPSNYNPREHPRAARARRAYVLERMAILGMISARAARRAKRAPLGVTPDPPRTGTREPYFVEAVRQELLSDPRLGVTREVRERRLLEGGLEVRTTLVPRFQNAAESAVREVLDQPGDPEAALIAIRPGTGEIVAMVGGRRWSSSQVNLALGARGGGSGRQAGSSFKPIVAAAAMESGIGLEALYESTPATFELPGGDPWSVHNAEGGSQGLMRLDEALVYSVNGVYARLGLQLGPDRIAEQARLMGVRSPLARVYSIALGSVEVSALDMAAAYATLANGGTAVSPTTIDDVELPSGATLSSNQTRLEHVLEPGNAYLLTRTLEQVIERGTGTAADIGRPAAGKTGTANDYGDAWFVGFTPQLVAAVWVGYPQGNVPMTSVHGIRVTGGSFPALIWRGFMARALAGRKVLDFRVPEGELVTVEIDPETGLLAAPWCPGREETMLRALAPTQTCPAPEPPVPAVTPVPSPSPTPTPSESPTPEASSSPRPSPSPSGDDQEKGGRRD